jgi:hypothetical protein
MKQYVCPELHHHEMPISTFCILFVFTVQPSETEKKVGERRLWMMTADYQHPEPDLAKLHALSDSPRCALRRT